MDFSHVLAADQDSRYCFVEILEMFGVWKGF